MTDGKRRRNTGNLTLRGRIWWARYYHEGTLVQESTGTTDQAKAEDILRKKMKPANTRLFVPPKATRLTFEALIALARADAKEEQNKTAARLGTAEQPRGPVIHLLDRFAGRLALSITDDEIIRYRDARLAEGAQLATVHRELAVLRRGYKLAVAKNLVPRMPVIKQRDEDNAREGFVDPPQFEALLGELRSRYPVAADMAEAGYLTLLRKSNICNLTWTQLRLDVEQGHVVGGELRLPAKVAKNKKALLLPLTGRLLALVDRRWRVTGDDLGRVFPHSVRRFRRVWKQATTAIGQPGLLVHDLRRSGARTLIRAGVPEDVVMRLGNWRTRSMLTRYNIVDTDDLADAQSRLDAALASPGPRTVVALRRVS